MIRAYSELYLRNARSSLANSFDYAVHTLGYSLEEYYHMFTRCDLARKFEKGDPFLIAGKSGIELALLVVEKYTGRDAYKERIYHYGKSREYWAGWALAFYQWYTACSFLRLEEEIPISSILDMYDKYHEMDIMHFVDRLNEIRQAGCMVTYLKKYRELRGISQSELSNMTGIPLRTLQHYEQGSKPLEKANFTYVFSLAKALDCKPEELITMEG